MTAARPAPARSDAGTHPSYDELLRRLCDAEADVVFFPVRHHSPAAAGLVGAWIERRRPRAVLIEGPSDFNPHLNELGLQHELPIAIYSYVRRPGGTSGAYYPFCEYSPEHHALTAAFRVEAQVAFIDMPWRLLAGDEAATHRYGDGELRRSRFTAELCQRLQVEDFDDLWDRLIESDFELDERTYLERCHALCLNSRLAAYPVADRDRRREAFMEQTMKSVLAEVGARPGPVLVVTGGFHSSALCWRWERAAHAGWSEWEELGASDALPPTQPPNHEPSGGEPSFEADGGGGTHEAGIALTAYSYARLDALTGYDAGMPSPGFYEEAHRQRARGRTFDHQPLLRKLVQQLRKRRQVLSTADLIAVETSARALARLRGRRHVWRRDLLDAVTSCLIKDELSYACGSPFIDAVHEVLRGERRGRLAAGTRTPPLVADIQRLLAEFELEAGQGARALELDLLEARDLTRSRVLHRLLVLGIRGYERTGGTDFLGREDLSRLWERWRLAWSPDFEASSIEAARYGSTLLDAARERLLEASQGAPRTAAQAAELLVQAARAGLTGAMGKLFSELAAAISSETKFPEVAATLEHLLFLYCHDEALGTAGQPEIAGLLVTAFQRSLWLLELLTGGDPSGNSVRGVRALWECLRRAALPELERDELVLVLGRVRRDPDKAADVRGAALGVLVSAGELPASEALAAMRGFADPSELGDFLTGVFSVTRELAQRDPEIIVALDGLLLELSAEDFVSALPSLRLAFTFFTPREKHHLLSTLWGSLGMTQRDPVRALAVSPEVAARALVFEERVFETLQRYGLEGDD
ncbi:MAG TPA: DUF5682 family protein [Polyangiaceae bacterium]